MVLARYFIVVVSRFWRGRPESTSKNRTSLKQIIVTIINNMQGYYYNFLNNIYF